MHLHEVQAALERTPGLLEGWLRELPDSWLQAGTSAAGWTARDIVAHLVQGEVEDWVPRARLLLEHGDARTFTPFDVEGFRESEAGRGLPELLARFAELRRANLDWLEQQAFSDEQLELRGTHPAFGAVSLRQLLSSWAVHDLSHIAQLARVLARSAREEVGPWRAYLPILDR